MGAPSLQWWGLDEGDFGSFTFSFQAFILIAVLALDFHGQANYVEAVLWWLIAAAFAYAWWSRRHKPEQARNRRQAAIAFITFLIFGITDVIEVQTGHWARPWWLFVLKAMCVVSMIYLLIEYQRSKKA